ncbi:MAG: 2-dehydropantoate 2-reductase PanG, partial [Melioribacteraceae bacterium]
MGQVPSRNDKPKYLIVGNGKLAKHFIYYFSSLNISYSQITRESIDAFENESLKTDRILVLINDDQIENFVAQHRKDFLEDKIWIHCSGVLSIEKAESAHPLVSFTEKLFDLEFYKSIPFVVEDGRRNLHELFPELPNPGFSIAQGKKGI